MHALEELKKSKEKNVLQQKLLEFEKEKHEQHEKAIKAIVDLRLQVEEATRIKEVLTSQLKKKNEICLSREGEIVFLKSEFERTVATNKK